MNRKRILIVEDEQIVAEDLKNSLENLGYEVAGMISSGEEAVNIATEASPDIVLMDIKLPGGLDGIETALQIRRQHRLPIIFLTAFSDDKTLDSAKLAEPYGYIIKPFEEKSLRSTLEMALYKSHMEMRLEHINNILRAIRQVNQLITREKDAAVLAEKVCRIFTDVRGYNLFWIALTDAAKNVTSLMAAEKKDGARSIKKVFRNGKLPRCGHQALEQADVLVWEDVSQCRDCPLPVRYSTGGALVGRLEYRGNIYGIMGSSMPVDYVADPEEISLFQELRDDLAYVIFRQGPILKTPRSVMRHQRPQSRQ